VVEQSVHQRAPRIAGSRMHNQARGFVDNQQIVILECDFQVQRFRLAGHADFRLRPDNDLLAAGDGVSRAYFPVINRHVALQNPGLEPASAVPGKHPGQRKVQTLTGQVRGDEFYERINRHTTNKIAIQNDVEFTVYLPIAPDSCKVLPRICQGSGIIRRSELSGGSDSLQR